MTRVLVVDDHEENRYLLRALLEGHAYDVDEARHGAEALVRARRSRPDLLVTDLLMPVMDGYTLLRRWKADERLSAIPVVVYTATYTEPQDERLALDLGADAFVVKPAEPERFLARLEELLARAATGALAPRRPIRQEPALLADYSEALVRKLEDKRFELERLNRELKAAAEFNQATLDAIAQHLCVLDERGAIVATNAAWRRFAAANGGDPDRLGAGADYLAVCDESAAAGDADAAAFAAGLRAVLSGERDEFELEYPCHAPDARRWFLGRVTRFASRQPPRLAVVHEDVTSEWRAREELRESRELFRRTLLDAPFPILLHAEDGEVVQVNRAWSELTGYREEELRTIGAWTELAYGERRDLVRSDIDRLYSLDRRVDEGEYVIRTREGAMRVWHFSSAPMGRMPDGRRLVISMAMDVTGRNLAEQRLRESEEHYRLLFESNPQPMWVYDLETLRFLAVNAAAVRRYGYSREEFLAMTIEDIRPTEDLPRLRDNLRTAPAEFEEAGLWRHRRSDGDLVDVEITSHALDFDGRRAKLVLALDVTARERALAELRASEERFRELAETVDDIFWITDADKSRMLYVSPAYEKVWGRGRGTLYESPLSWLDAVHPEDRERVERASRESQVSGGYDEEYRIQRPDGETRWIRDRAYPVIDAQGRVERVVGIARDITTQRELAEQLRESQKLEAVGRLAGGVAHDFNNLLAVILMQAELLEPGTADVEAVRSGLAEIRAAAERGASLTRQLLLFGRRQTLALRDLDLNEVVSGFATMLRRLLGEDVELELRLHGRPLAARADAGMLEQVMMNLAVNARDAMPRGGTLRLETSERQVAAGEPRVGDGAAPGRYVRLRVADTGCGIAPEVLPYLFEPFFTTKEPGKGSGLGLATVFGIVRQHGGWLEVASEPGEGATFDVYLPEAGDARHEEATPRARPAPRGSETILLVEDEANLRRIAGRVLGAHGYRVLVASTGEEALHLWEADPEAVDLLVTDLVLPGGMSGLDLATQLEERAPRLRVLLTSGYSPELAGVEPPSGPGRGYLQKPATLGALLAAVRRCLDD